MTGYTDTWPPVSSELLGLLDVAALARQQVGNLQIDGLVAEPRFHDRLLQLLVGGPVPLGAVEDAGDRQVLRADASRWAHLSRASGAVCHAQTFACAIQASQLQALIDRLGRELYELALTHRTLAWLPALTSDQAELEATVVAAGEACMAAWFSQLPGPLQAWMRLRGFAAQPALDDEHDARRVAIVRAVAVDFLSEAAGRS